MSGKEAELTSAASSRTFRASLLLADEPIGIHQLTNSRLNPLFDGLKGLYSHFEESEAT